MCLIALNKPNQTRPLSRLRERGAASPPLGSYSLLELQGPLSQAEHIQFAFESKKARSDVCEPCYRGALMPGEEAHSSAKRSFILLSAQSVEEPRYETSPTRTRTIDKQQTRERRRQKQRPITNRTTTKPQRLEAPKRQGERWRRRLDETRVGKVYLGV
ncbi:hypothetical protein F2Q70_00006861 [Brassica cretica]|uniref:Uncharacterized protein n=1 Tax=Brassica cretica TaxID=69181 RepID=A0A8S9FQ45_BRACR|nr:hypothetical protein F2Q68_00023532 [Brassica cretica]KAF2575098.1 hypothetical protein F2Q70_00006861 [Brassica cretica]